MKKQSTIAPHSRRQFIKYGTLAAGSMMVTGPYVVRGQNLNSKLNIAQIGCGGQGDGKGWGDVIWCARAGENVTALCDVDANSTAFVKQKLYEALKTETAVYKDYRDLLEKEKHVDAVDIATPDHMHAVIAAAAIKLGKHVYCQKPLTHDIFEARTLRDLARQHKVATQMGNQGSASDSLRRAVEVVQGGIVGPVRQAYVWTNRPIWPQGYDRPSGIDPVPAGLDWNLWLGTAPTRPFLNLWPEDKQSAWAKNVYHPRSWRAWYDFGTGALGDMACHTVNWPFRSLKLSYPTEIEASTSGVKPEMYPARSSIRFEFPAREGMPAVTLHWADGGNRPPASVTDVITANFGRVSDSGCLMIGDNGVIFSPDDGDQDLRTFVKLKGDEGMMGLENHPAAKAIAQTIPRNAFSGPPDFRQHTEWIQACKDGKLDVPYSRFDVAAYLTEIMLLGCVALRTGKKLDWDGPTMTAKSVPEAAAIVKRAYRAGWSI